MIAVRLREGLACSKLRTPLFLGKGATHKLKPSPSISLMLPLSSILAPHSTHHSFLPFYPIDMHAVVWGMQCTKQNKQPISTVMQSSVTATLGNCRTLLYVQLCLSKHKHLENINQRSWKQDKYETEDKLKDMGSNHNRLR